MAKGSDEIWITGVGCATSLGLDFKTLADNIMAGRSGIAPIARFDASDHVARIGAELPDLPCPPGYSVEDFQSRDPWMQMLLWSAVNALRDADLTDQHRIGLVVGIGAESMQVWERHAHAGVDAIRHPENDGQGLVATLRSLLQLSGPSTTVAAACASGNAALGIARQWIEMGLVDVVLAGGGDRGVTRMGVASFGNLRTLSRRNNDPQRASRPFDVDRDGFVVGEGAALMVLESGPRARKRRARPYGELLGYGVRNDAFHLVAPSSDPTHAAAAVQNALASAQVNAADIDYVNAHAPGTSAGDIFEAKVLQASLGSSFATIPVSSSKSMTGHLLSAASAIEAVISLAAIDRQAAPPTINLDTIDPECQLCHIPHEAQER
ncbi:MAG: beta-ketoacyl-[acyl-carrier-protein] synthase family protein, partial [Planctomycetota bacterium]